MTRKEFEQLRIGALNHALRINAANVLAEKLGSVSVYFPDFVGGFVQCLGFIATDDEGEPLFDCAGDFENVDVWGEIRDTLSAVDCFRIISDCADFVIKSGLDNIPELDNEDCDHRESVYSNAGHDFCLTRNRHGAGFWDGDWKEPFASIATKVSESFGVVELECEKGEYFLFHNRCK